VIGLPIYRKTESASVALYAVAIVPKTVIAARGVGSLVGRPLAFIVSLVPLVLGLVGALRLHDWIYQKVSVNFLANLLGLLMLFTFLFLVRAYGRFIVSRVFENPWVRPLLGMSKERRMSEDSQSKNQQQSQPRIIWRRFLNLVAKFLPYFFLYVPLSFILIRLGAVGGDLDFVVIQVDLNSQIESILPWVKGWIAAYMFIGVLFFWSFVMLMPQVITGDPQLPDVKITLSDSDELEVGKLIDHSGGTWHFFDREWTLKVIPDGQVREAEVCEETGKPSGPNAT
jgi:hypothetical protein